MQIAIVGHGPSLLKARLGQKIDDHDKVVRCKRSWELPERYPDYYGRKTDVAVGSLVVIEAMIKGWQARGVNIFWSFYDTRTDHVEVAFEQNVILDRELCQHWRGIYRDLRPVIALDEAQKAINGLSDERGHLHPSAGMYAIIYALHFEKPDLLSLYGFDSLTTGRFTWSVTRGSEWMEYPDHNWAAEKALLAAVAEHYGYHLTQVNGTASLVRLDKIHAA